MLNFLADTDMTRMYWYMMCTLTTGVSMPSVVDGTGWYIDDIELLVSGSTNNDGQSTKRYQHAIGKWWWKVLNWCHW
jgi:hypothetical protein